MSQTNTSLRYDCNEDINLYDSSYIHRPSKENFFALIHLESIHEWKTKDSISFSTFTTDNMTNGILVARASPLTKGEGELEFFSLDVLNHGEYGRYYSKKNNSYDTYFYYRNNIITIREFKEGLRKLKRKKYKFKVKWVGTNCCKWIRLK